MAKGKNVLTTGDVAKICNVAPRTVSKWFDSGQLKGYRIPGSKDRRIPMTELVRFMKQHGMPTDALPVGKTRVLIVCTDEKISDPLAETLREKADYDVKVVTNDFETGATAQKFVPHVMLLDLADSEIEASRICKSIRDDEELQTMKILAMVNGLSDSEHAALIGQGFDGFVEKTAGPDAVIRQIEQATAIIY